MKPAGAGGRRSKSQTSWAVGVVLLCVALLAGITVWDGLTGPVDADDDFTPVGISVFTLVATGIVFVEPDTSEIVWKNDRGDSRTIGERPWRHEGPTRPNEATGYLAWREHRDIVGNPDHDLVSWVETSDGQRGDLLVLQASTGHILARASISEPEERTVIIASVNARTVYFATPSPTTGFPDVPGSDIWVWRWAAGEAPNKVRSARYFNDVSSGTWAVYGDGVEFENVQGQTLATFPYPEITTTDFGGALSPDGRYWYGAGTTQVVETATGDAVTLPGARERNYSWTGPAQLTLTRPFMVCSAVTGLCLGPASLFPHDVCAPYDIVCGDNLPVN